MRVCLICEGSYPYVPGGVSTWVQTLCSQFQDVEFVVWAIVTTREEMPEYRYRIPKNVVEVRTLYLGDAKFKKTGQKIRLTQEEKETLKGLVCGSPDAINWMGVLDLAKRHRQHMSDLLMSESFFDICLEEYLKQNSRKVFLHFLWSFRGIYFPLMYSLSQGIPKADIYHAVSAGYAGIMGSCASYIEGVPLLLSEHGIYTREREEDIIRSQWVEGEFKGLWIDFFKKLSFISYQQASVVTTLFRTSRSLQIELKCPPEKIVIIPNGVRAEDFASCREKKKSGSFVLGAVLRVVPIKDVKTMLLAFDIVKRAVPETRLKIMGNCSEDPVYYHECKEFLEELGTEDVEFLGLVNIKEHLPEVDLLLLSSLSEGQPLAILEGLAAETPFVTTNIGDCKALLEGEREDDTFGPAGLVVPVMNSEAMAQAILRCIRNPSLVTSMGQAGRKRVEAYYSLEGMLDSFHKVYEHLEEVSHGRNRI